jgi:anaerobic magnesium-protoporphyrin IX monomethyl ester cyclase
MKVSLVYPPFVPDNRAFPPLSLPALTAYLRQQQHAVTQHDVNIEFFHYLLRHETLSALEESVVRGLAAEKRRRPRTLRELQRLCMREDGLGVWLPYALDEMHAAGGDHRKLNGRTYSHLIDKLSDLLTLPYTTHAPLVEMTSREYIESVRSDHDSLLMRYFAEHVVPTLLAHQPDVVGMSLMTEEQFFPALLLAHILKQRHPGVSIVFGGGYISAVADKIGSRSSEIFALVDAFVAFDGEHALADILQRLQTGRSLSGVPNSITWNPSRQQIERTAPLETGSLDDLPMPDFDGLDLTLYTRRILPYYMTKGCAFGRCAYCSDPAYSSARTRSGVRAAGELETLVRRYNPDTIIFVDSYIHPDKLAPVATELIRRGLHTRWLMQTRMDRFLTTDRIRLFAEAGCDELWFGMETVNRRLIKLIRKGSTREIIERILRDCCAAGIRVTLNCMIGFPTETMEEADDTVEFVDSLGRLQPDLAFKCNTGFVFVPRLSAFGQTPEKFGITVVDEFEWSPRLEWIPPDWRDRPRFLGMEGRIFDERYQTGAEYADELAAEMHKIAGDTVIQRAAHVYMQHADYDILACWRRLYSSLALLRDRQRTHTMAKHELLPEIDDTVAQDSAVAQDVPVNRTVAYVVDKALGRRIVALNPFHLLLLRLVQRATTVEAVCERLVDMYPQRNRREIDEACLFGVRTLAKHGVFEVCSADEKPRENVGALCERKNFGEQVTQPAGR